MDVAEPTVFSEKQPSLKKFLSKIRMVTLSNVIFRPLSRTTSWSHGSEFLRVKSQMKAFVCLPKPNGGNFSHVLGISAKKIFLSNEGRLARLSLPSKFNLVARLKYDH